MNIRFQINWENIFRITKQSWLNILPNDLFVILECCTLDVLKETASSSDIVLITLSLYIIYFFYCYILQKLTDQMHFLKLILKVNLITIIMYMFSFLHMFTILVFYWIYSNNWINTEHGQKWLINPHFHSSNLSVSL